MKWFLFALGGPILWAFVNHIDKYIISRYFSGRGVGSLVVFTSLSGIIISFLILIFNFESIFIGSFYAFVIAINGALLVSAFIPYLYALEKEEASWASSLYQLIPIFGYFLALIFLDEHLNIKQIFAGILVIIGAIIISLDFSHKIKFKIKPFALMILSSFMIAVNALVFKMIAVNASFWGTAFWEYVGGGIFGALLLTFIPLYRKQFFATIEKGRVTVLSINLTSELLNIGAKLAANFASLLAPLALVWIVNGLQPFLVFFYGVLLTLFAPSFGKEDLSAKTITQKLCAMIIIFVGIYFLFRA